MLGRERVIRPIEKVCTFLVFEPFWYWVKVLRFVLGLLYFFRFHFVFSYLLTVMLDYRFVHLLHIFISFVFSQRGVKSLGAARLKNFRTARLIVLGGVFLLVRGVSTPITYHVTSFFQWKWADLTLYTCKEKFGQKSQVSIKCHNFHSFKEKVISYVSVSLNNVYYFYIAQPSLQFF